MGAWDEHYMAADSISIVSMPHGVSKTRMRDDGSSAKRASTVLRKKVSQAIEWRKETDRVLAQEGSRAITDFCFCFRINVTPAVPKLPTKIVIPLTTSWKGAASHRSSSALPFGNKRKCI